MQVKFPSHFGFYGILTEPLCGYEYCTRVLIEHEIAFVQLRAKNSAPTEIRIIAEKMRRLTEGTKTMFIVNDDPALGADCRADGVHIGQGDMPYAQARKIIGDTAIIGVSTHSVEQVQKTCAGALCPDYIGVGPVFPTPTKKNPDPVIGLRTMQQMISQATVPAVAIGGISLENLPDVLTAGARNFCMVRPINQAQDPEKALREILKIYRDVT
jgi:thiamine-phosphate pyrophosphorylase